MAINVTQEQYDFIKGQHDNVVNDISGVQYNLTALQLRESVLSDILDELTVV